MYGNVLGRIDANANLVAFDGQDGDLNTVSNQNRLPHLTR